MNGDGFLKPKHLCECGGSLSVRRRPRSNFFFVAHASGSRTEIVCENGERCTAQKKEKAMAISDDKKFLAAIKRFRQFGDEKALKEVHEKLKEADPGEWERLVKLARG